MKQLPRTLLLSAAAIACGAAHAQGLSVRIPMSAQEVLAMGNDPSEGAFFKLPVQPGLLDSDAQQAKGGGTTNYTSIAGIAFRPKADAAKFASPNFSSLLCQVNSITPFAEAQVQLPQGATIQVMRIWGIDASEIDFNVALIERCQPLNTPANVTTTVLTSIVSSGFPGNFTSSAFLPANTTVDNNQCLYAMRVQLNSVASGCAASLLLEKARLQWNP